LQLIDIYLLYKCTQPHHDYAQEINELYSMLNQMTSKIEKEKAVSEKDLGNIATTITQLKSNIKEIESCSNETQIMLLDNIKLIQKSDGHRVPPLLQDIHGQVLHLESKMQHLQLQMRLEKQRIQSQMQLLQSKIQYLQSQVQHLDSETQASLASTYNGMFIWKITEVCQRIEDAKIGCITSIYSSPFYTGKNGYKMYIRAYLNGYGIGEGTHLAVFFVLVKSEYDSLLQWPFKHKVSLILISQDRSGKNITQSFKPTAQQPSQDDCIAIGCPKFAELSVLNNPRYVKDDAMYIKAIVDTSKIIHP